MSVRYPHEYAYDFGNVTAYSQLTRQHRRVVRLVAQGRTDLEIARRLYIERQTVKNYLTTIYAAVGIPRQDEGYSPRVLLAWWYWKQEG